MRVIILIIHVTKSKFFWTSLTFLGHVVSADGVQIDPEKTQSVQSFSVPTNRKSIEYFLCGWMVPSVRSLFSLLQAMFFCEQNTCVDLALLTLHRSSYQQTHSTTSERDDIITRSSIKLQQDNNTVHNITRVRV